MKSKLNIPSILKGQGFKFIILLYIIIAIIGLLIDSNALSSATDIKNAYLAPFEHPDYLLGTDALGRSVLYGLINGAKVSLIIAVLTSIFSLALGLIFAFISGYLGNDKISVSRGLLIGLIFFTIVCLFYFTYSSSKLICFILWFSIVLLAFIFNSKNSSNREKISIPFDAIILKGLEIIKTIPGIFLILFFLSLFGVRSTWNLILIITILRIPIIVRLGRSEILKLKNQEYILAVEGMGISTIRLFFSHIVPNIITPIRSYLVYGLATTILIESVLSFLGLGLPIEIVTWGSMLSSSRQFFSAWWLAILPGLAIFILIYALRNYFKDRSEEQEYFYI